VDKANEIAQQAAADDSTEHKCYICKEPFLKGHQGTHIDCQHCEARHMHPASCINEVLNRPEHLETMETRRIPLSEIACPAHREDHTYLDERRRIFTPYMTWEMDWRQTLMHVLFIIVIIMFSIWNGRLGAGHVAVFTALVQLIIHLPTVLTGNASKNLRMWLFLSYNIIQLMVIFPYLSNLKVTEGAIYSIVLGRDTLFIYALRAIFLLSVYDASNKILVILYLLLFLFAPDTVILDAGTFPLFDLLVWIYDVMYAVNTITFLLGMCFLPDATWMSKTHRYYYDKDGSQTVFNRH